jgi:hypothetical protein
LEESFLRLLQHLIIIGEYRPVPTLDNPLMILLLMMHAGVIIAIWEGEQNYALGKNLNTFTSEHDNTNNKLHTSNGVICSNVGVVASILP